MIIPNNNHQQNILYFKQYPCYSMTTHLSQHRELEFAHVTLVRFSNKTAPKCDLPKFYIDKYQAPQQMYWLEWRMEDVMEDVIEEGRVRINYINSEAQSLLAQSNNKLQTQSLRKINCRCLYIAQVGKVAHIKLVFNSDPEIVAICQDFLYTIGGNQLIITELWPQTTTSQQIKNMNSIQQIPPKQSQIKHKLDQQSKVLSMDFICDQEGRVMCKVIYFNQKKGIYAQIYKKHQPSESSLLGKIIDFSLKFKKSQPQPLHYQTLVPNILGILIYNPKQFILFDLTSMTPIPHTKSTLQGWQLNHHQPIVIKTRENTVHQNYNDCLLIGIGQGVHIEIFLFHIKYSSTSTLLLPGDNTTKPACELQNWPIHMFSSGEFIDFQHSIIKHWTVIYLQRVSKLSSFILSINGLVYLGYDQRQNDGYSEQMPSAGFVDYEKLYVTHEILMQEDRVWREYKEDVMIGLGDQQKGDRVEECLQRLLIPGRYETSFILSTLNLPSITSLPSLLHHPSTSFKQINQKLLYTWRNDYKFIQFTIYHQQFLIIRRNSISTLIEITSQEYSSAKDKNAQIEVGYDRLLKRDFDDIEVEESQYEERMRVLGGRIKDVMSEQYYYDKGGQIEQRMPIGGYYDEQQYKKCSQLYKQTLHTITQLAKRPTLTPPQRSFTEHQFQQQQHSTSPFITHNKHILLHASTLSLRVKDQLGYYIDSLRANYEYYVEGLVRGGKGEVVESVRLRHAYTVYVLQWVRDIATKSHLQMQLALFTTDLISEFINHYITNYCKGSYIQQNGTVLTTDNKLYRTDLDIHVNNVFSLLLRGLLREIDFTMWDGNIVQQARDVMEMSQEEVVTDRVGKINCQANPFIMMLLKRHNQVSHQSGFIIDSIINTLFQPLLLNPTNPTLSLLLPINKTFVYSILSLPLKRQQKLRILSSYMNRTQFLSILLLIQLQNNCYLLMDQGMQVEIYGNNVEMFVNNTVRLERQACCLLEEIILTNYRLFLFPTSQQQQHTTPNHYHTSPSDPQLHQHQQALNQAISIQFIKLLFSNIDFMQLTFMITRPLKVNQQRLQKRGFMMGYKGESQLLQMGIENDKGLAYVYRQLMLQVERINQHYGRVKATPIQRTFNKFFNKIYHPKHQPYTSQQNQQTYPQLTGLDYHLSLEQLDVIDRLYAKHWKLLKIDKKQSFQSTAIIQQVILCYYHLLQRLSLEYSMLKIYMFRLNLALKEISLLTEGDKLVYVEIMKRCVEALREAVKCFKHWREKLVEETNQERKEINDEEFLSILVEIDNMQNSAVWNDTLNDTQQTIISPANLSTKNWQILDIPLSSQWLQLLLLTFNIDPPSHLTTIKPADMIFTNYQSHDSILMKMLIVIKKQRLVRQYEALNKMFGKEKVDEVIQGNEMLRRLYVKGLESDRQGEGFGQYVNTGSRGLLGYGGN